MAEEPPFKKRMLDVDQNGQNGQNDSVEFCKSSQGFTRISELCASGSEPDSKSSKADSKSDQNSEPESKAEETSKLKLSSLANLEVVKVLSSSDANCSVALEARHDSLPGRVLLHLQKMPFDLTKLDQVVSLDTRLEPILHNDIYSKYSALLPPHLNRVQANVVWPAGDAELRRHERLPLSVVEETPQLYESFTRPFVQAGGGTRLQWLYNILDGTAEQDRVVLRDEDPATGFVLVQDLKWTGEQTVDLYCQAIVNRRDLASLRDLDGDCLGLLRNIRDKGLEAIQQKYGVEACRLRVYLHYLPSFYHLHVHFSALTFDAPGTGCGKAHLLSDVISNLEQNGAHYRTATLAFTLRDNHPHPLARGRLQDDLGNKNKDLENKEKESENTDKGLENEKKDLENTANDLGNKV